MKTRLTIVIIVNALFLPACHPRDDPSLRQELRSESAKNGLAIVEALGSSVAVVSFDGNERYFDTGSRQLLVFSNSGRAVLWWNMPNLLPPGEMTIETIDGKKLIQKRQPRSQFFPLALAESAERLAFQGTSKGGALQLQWASFDFSQGGLIGYVRGSCDWSPDGSALVYSDEGEIHIFDVSSGTSKPLTKGDDPTWSPDGKLIAHRDYDSHAALITKEGLPIKSPLNAYSPIHPLRWSPDGRYVLFPERVTDRIPLIDHYRLVICRVSDGGSIIFREFGAGTGDTGNFHWIVDYPKFCGSCKPGIPFN